MKIIEEVFTVLKRLDLEVADENVYYVLNRTTFGSGPFYQIAFYIGPVYFSLSVSAILVEDMEECIKYIGRQIEKQLKARMEERPKAFAKYITKKVVTDG